MFALQSRKDGFRVTLPDDFLVDEIKEKYAPKLQQAHSFIYKPIDFLNETIQKVQVFGFQNGTLEQPQPTAGNPIRGGRLSDNRFPMGGSTFQYRNQVSPIALTDKTLNIEFRHTLGYTNYMMIFENFIMLYARDTRSDKMFKQIKIELFNQLGEVYAILRLKDPVMSAMDMLDFDYTQPISASGTFKVEFKYSNFDYEFVPYQEKSSLDDIAILNKDYVIVNK